MSYYFLEGRKMATKKTDFTGEAFISSDGKNTVHFTADSEAGRKAGMAWAINAYKWLVEEFGTKADMWSEAMNGKKPPQPQPQPKLVDCQHYDRVELIVKKPGPNQGRKFILCKDCNKFLKWSV